MKSSFSTAFGASSSRRDFELASGLFDARRIPALLFMRSVTLQCSEASFLLAAASNSWSSIAWSASTGIIHLSSRIAAPSRSMLYRLASERARVRGCGTPLRFTFFA